MKENEFKVGDSVRLIYKSHRRPYKVLEVIGDEVLLNTQEYPKRDNIWKIKDCEKWIPKENEWCWFKNNNGIYSLAQYEAGDIYDINSAIKSVQIGPHGNSYWGICKPFIGEFPYEW